jgi:hypothetical protein
MIMKIDREYLLINIELYKETEDNWCGNYIIKEFNISLVKVRFFCINPFSENNNIWRVLCSGTDDAEMCYDGNIFETVRGIFFDVIAERYVNFYNLKKLGFKQY